MKSLNREIVQVVSSAEYDKCLADTAVQLGIDKDLLVRALIENSVINAMLQEEEFDKPKLKLFSQDEWMSFVTKETIKLHESGELEELKKLATGKLSDAIH